MPFMSTFNLKKSIDTKSISQVRFWIREINRQIGDAAAVMQTLYWSITVKRELRFYAQLSIYLSVYVPTLNCDHELWVVIERTGSWIQAAEMSFFQGKSGFSLRDRVRCSIILEGLRVELLFHIKKSPLWSFIWPDVSYARCFRQVPIGGDPQAKMEEIPLLWLLPQRRRPG